MAKKDTVAGKYMSDSRNFADLFNFFLYGGKKVIKPEELSELDARQTALLFTKRGKMIPLQRIRDVLKHTCIMRNGVSTFVLLGIENQAEVNYAMPVRNMLYDALQYASQVTEIQNQHKEAHELVDSAEFLSGLKPEDKLKPVITLTLYLKPGAWDGARRLRDMFDTIPRSLLKYAQDYRMNIIVPSEIEDKDFDRFGTDLKQVLKYIKYSGDTEKLREMVASDVEFKALEKRTVDMINVITNSNLKYRARKGKVNMCKAIEGIREEGRVEGRIEGRMEGRSEGTIITLYGLVVDGVITIDAAANRADMTVEEFLKKTEEFISDSADT